MGINKRIEGYAKWAAPWLGLIISVFHLWTLSFKAISPAIFRSVHVLMAVTLVLLLYPTIVGRKKREYRIIDFLLIIVAVFTFTYTAFEIDFIMDRGGLTNTPADYIFATTAIIIILETTRRTVGSALPIIALFFLAYAMFGDLIQGSFGHAGYSYARIISTVLSYDGIFGLPIAVVSTFVTMFIIFGGILNSTGVGDFFIELSKSLAGKQRGGPAKIAVIASAFFGSISGSAIANTVSTGSVTIPLMKKVGYKPSFAAAVEAAASTGGQIMPPVMAAGAFIMAEILGVPYVKVMKAAIIPALIYFTTIWITIDLRAVKIGLKKLPDSEILPLFPLLHKKGILLLPLFILIYFLVIIRISPIKAAFWSILSAVVLYLMVRDSDTLKQKGNKIIEGLKISPFTLVQISVASACAGIVIGIIGLTGLGLKIAGLVVEFSMGYKIITLILTMITCIFFGMGLPTSVAYILVASVLAPALINIGIIPIAAHMFVFYFSILAVITPPVALAAYAGAGIAGANPMETGFIALKLALTAFIVPYMFVYGPALLMLGDIFHIALAAITALLGCFGLAAGLEGWIFHRTIWYERILLVAGALLLIFAEKVTDLVGFVLMCTVFLIHWRNNGKFLERSKNDVIFK